MACYVIAHVTVNNPEAYSGYTAGTPGTIAAYGGKFVVRGGASRKVAPILQPGAGAKQEQTQQKRVEKCNPKIFARRGLNEYL